MFFLLLLFAEGVRTLKKISKGVIIAITLIVSYRIFMQVNDYRIADFQSIEMVNNLQ